MQTTIDIAQLLQAVVENKPDHSDDKLLSFPKKEGVAVKPAETRIGLPEGTTAEKAALILNEHAQSLKEQVRVVRKFKARLEDVQVAVNRLCLQTWGTSGKGKVQRDFFGGAHPPVTDSITVGLDERGYPITETVPVSSFTMAPLEAELDYGRWQHEEFGLLGMVSVVSKKGNERAVRQFLDAVEEQVRQHSIYKGKVLSFKRKKSAEDGHAYELQHVEARVDDGIVYNRFTETRLEQKLFGRIKYAESIAQATKGKMTFRTLLYGPYGTGKTECTTAAAKVATDEGWTTIFFTPGEADGITYLSAAYSTAEMYSPALLVVEDIDKYYVHSGESANGHSQITNILDGPMTKSSKVSVLMTTNNLDRIDPSATRPGRLDGMIEISSLDREATERMFQILLADELDDDIDFDAIYEVVKETGPSFIRATFEDARKNSIITNHGEMGHKLTTIDLVEAATQALEQSEEHTKTTAPTKEEAFYATFQEVAKVFFKASGVEGAFPITEERLRQLAAKWDIS